MKAQRRFGPALSWPPIASAFLVGVAVLVLARPLAIPRAVYSMRNIQEVCIVGIS
jgi:hypothetical protein